MSLKKKIAFFQNRLEIEFFIQYAWIPINYGCPFNLQSRGSDQIALDKECL